MKLCIRSFALLFLLAIAQAQAAKIALEFKGQKQVVEFNPSDPKDLDRAERLWMKADHKTFYVYSETGGFQVCEEPHNDSKCKTYGGWYQQLSTSNVTSPHFASVVWDKTKWHPRDAYQNPGWLKLDDPNLIWPNQLKPVKDWPIRYIAYYGGIEMNAPDDGQERKYDEYVRYQFDRDGYLLNNRTMKRNKFGENFIRMFQYQNFVKLTAVAPASPDIAVSKDGGMGFAFNLKQALADPKIEYDKHSDFISVWATFDDPVKPIYDKHNNNACVIDCKSRKRWAP